MRSSSLVGAVLAPSSPEETTPVQTKTINEKAERQIPGAARRPSAQNTELRASRETKPSLPDSSSLAPESSSTPAEATPVPNEEAFGPGGTASQSGGIDIGSAGGSPSGKGTTAGGAGSAGNSAVSMGRGSGQHDTSGYRGAPGTRPGGGIFQPAIPTPPVKIPAEEFRGLPFALSEVYIEVDRYVLYGHNLRQGISVPANEICLEGDLLRTRETATFKRTVTDMSKCRTTREGDDEVVTCPSNAETKVILFNDYLFSPVVYGVRTCLSYDRSHCSLLDPGDGEREYCRPSDNLYQGIWAAGTKFDYKCTKLNVETFSHPLDYKIRFLRNAFVGHNVPSRKTLLHTTTQPIPRCSYLNK